MKKDEAIVCLKISFIMGRLCFGQDDSTTRLGVSWCVDVTRYAAGRSLVEQFVHIDIANGHFR